MLGQIRPAYGRFIDHLRDCSEIGTVTHPFGENFDGSYDNCQNIIEVVGDAPGQLTDSLHFLGLSKLRFRGDLVGQVANETVENVPTAALERRYAQLNLDFGAVASSSLNFKTRSEYRTIPGPQKVLEAFLVAGTMRLRNDQFCQHPSNRIGARPSENLLGLRVPVCDDPFIIHLNKGIESGFDNPARHSLAVKQGASCASRISVMSRPMKKCRRTGSDHVPIQASETTLPSR